MTRLPILLHVVADETGKMCSSECPQFVAPSGGWRAQCRTPAGYAGMGQYGGDNAPTERLEWCLAAEAAAREAEAQAAERGFECAVENVGVHDNMHEWNAAGRALNAELDRIRGGDR